MNVLQDLKEYFKKTPKKVIEKDMKDLDEYNKTGPDMMDILPNNNVVEKQKSISEMIYLGDNIKELNKFIERFTEERKDVSNKAVFIPRELDSVIIDAARTRIGNLQAELDKYIIYKK